MSKKPPVTSYAINKKANFEYNIHDRFEAGIVLTGNEVKSIRLGSCNINESFITESNTQIYLNNCHISIYANARESDYNPTRTRKLLLKHKEINKIIGFIKRAGSSAIPIKLYNSERNFLKLEIALVTGKKLYDKRESIKQREWDRTKSRILKEQ